MMMMENNKITPFINNNNNISTITSSLFAVTFFDGEREVDMGTVQITPSLTFKSFQSILSQKLQISPHQITIYFERQQTPTINNNYHHNNHHHRRRHPVTSKFDFGSIMSESNTSFFWVVQKRSRRTRRRKPKNSINNHQPSSPSSVFPMENNNNFVLLRRDYNELDYLRMLQFEREKERYLMSLNLNSNVYDDLSCFYNNGGGYNGGAGGGFGGGGVVGGGYNGNFSDDGASSSGGGSSIDYSRVIGFCDVCFNYALNFGETTNSTNNTVPFHCCKNDAVTQVYRSTAGPIGPPKKK